MTRQVLVDAEVLERLLNEATYGNDQNTWCMACCVPEPRHAPDCPVPVLQAALTTPPTLARQYAALLDAHLALRAQLAQAEGREARLREAARNVMVMASPHFSDGTQLLALRELSDALAQAGKG